MVEGMDLNAIDDEAVGHAGGVELRPNSVDDSKLDKLTSLIQKLVFMNLVLVVGVFMCVFVMVLK